LPPTKSGPRALFMEPEPHHESRSPSLRRGRGGGAGASGGTLSGGRGGRWLCTLLRRRRGRIFWGTVAEVEKDVDGHHHDKHTDNDGRVVEGVEEPTHHLGHNLSVGDPLSGVSSLVVAGCATGSARPLVGAHSLGGSFVASTYHTSVPTQPSSGTNVKVFQHFSTLRLRLRLSARCAGLCPARLSARSSLRLALSAIGLSGLALLRTRNRCL
jgi:hypothetical protein